MKLKRLLATIIDLVVLSFIGGFLNIIMSFNEFTAALAFSLTFSLLLCKDNINGQGIGKRLFKIRIINTGSKEITNKLTYLLRNIFLILWPLEIIVLLLSGSRLADLVTNTTVVSSENQKMLISKKDILFIVYVFVVLSVITIIFLHSPSNLSSKLKLLYR